MRRYLRVLLVLLVLLVLAPLVALADPCSWKEPGLNPYKGTVYAAVMRYTDIPMPTRWFLALKASSVRQADDRAEISRDFILSKRHVYIDPRDMHFGQSSVCKRFDRMMWPDSHREPANVFSLGGYSVAVPDVCGNVFRLDRARPVLAARTAAHPIPEPGGMALAGLALAALVLVGRKR